MTVRSQRIYWDQLERGVDGDDAARIAAGDEAAIRLAEFIAAQPAHNGPIEAKALLPGDLQTYLNTED